MTDPDDLSVAGVAAIVGGLGIASGWLLSGELAFAMYCLLAGGGLAALIAGVVAIEMQDRRSAMQHRRQMAEHEQKLAIIREHMPAVEMAIVKGTLMEVVAGGRDP